MNLRSSEPFWLLNSGLIRTYPSLNTNIKADVAIVGAGITGALVAWHLCRKGFKVVVLDRRHVGMGSTAASTSLLQYEIDTSLTELSERIGAKSAARCYQLCIDAIESLNKISSGLKEPVGFERKPSFQYASFKSHLPGLRQEFALRQKNRIEVRWLDEPDIRKKFGFAAPAGILSKDGAQVDAYRLTHGILAQAVERGVEVFDGTEVVGMTHRRSVVSLKTEGGYTVWAKKLVIACGYESQKYLPKKVEEFHSTYAIASEPQERKTIWHKNSLIWETATPYLYLRTTSDNRIIIGGKDDAFSDPNRRAANLPRKAKLLEKAFGQLFPDIPFKTDFQWAGTFAGTKDGLPYIGSTGSQGATYYALGFGGNGITFSLIAAQVLTDEFRGKKNNDASLFAFAR